MIKWFKHLDELLRGNRTTAANGSLGRVDVPLRLFVPIAIGLGSTYGFFMGWFGVVSRSSPIYLQLLAGMIKLPALFLLTLMVTLPSLYVFNALLGSKLSFASTFRLLVGAIVVNLAVAAAFGPILGFFTISTTSYAFMILLNVTLLAIAGLVGLGFLLKALRGVSDRVPKTTVAGDDPKLEGQPPRFDQGMQATAIFRVWLVIYSLVGAQMGWLLRPFIGDPALPFAWFRARHGNFFQAVFQQLQNLLGGGS